MVVYNYGGTGKLETGKKTRYRPTIIHYRSSLSNTFSPNKKYYNEFCVWFKNKLKEPLKTETVGEQRVPGGKK